MNIYSKIRSGLLAAVVTSGLVLSGGVVFAAGHTGDVAITGTVEPMNTIGIETLANPIGVNALNAGVGDAEIANVTETSNSDTGYIVTLGSTNVAEAGTQARLVGSTTGNFINYSIAYGPVENVIAISTAPTEVTNVDAATSTTGVTKKLRVTTDAAATGEWYAADSYSDTLTLTIAAK